jgi:hypothetical protein
LTMAKSGSTRESFMAFPFAGGGMPARGAPILLIFDDRITPALRNPDDAGPLGMARATGLQERRRRWKVQASLSVLQLTH